ncbi:hypothetical protein LV779_07500 [Streptomyces thinghirensis]|nr:hypothetical protein [Streptomyces thinghirensis]
MGSQSLQPLHIVEIRRGFGAYVGTMSLEVGLMHRHFDDIRNRLSRH